MTVAVMQPYILPYIGYFQLVKSVDLFVFYDDVNFIKQGWINRNKILTGGKELLFTIPLKDASSFATIRDTEVNVIQFEKWRSKFLKTVSLSYKKALFFDKVYPIIEDVLMHSFSSISDYACLSVEKIASYLELKTKFSLSSVDYSDTKELDREARLLEIIKRNHSDRYINPIGGQVLYEKERFATHGITLDFIKSKPIVYQQFDNEFVPWLSILDVLMFNDVAMVNQLLDQYELV